VPEVYPVPVAAPFEAERSLFSETIASAIQSAIYSPRGQRHRSTLNAKRKFPYKEPELARHSHPITSANGSVRLRSVDTGSTGTTLNDLAAGSRDGSWLGCTGSMLGGWSSGSGSVGTGTAWLLILVLGWLLSCGLGNGLGILLVLVDSPIEDIVILETLTNEEITEDLSKVRVIWLVIEAEGTSVVEVDGELVGEASAENFSWGSHLLLHDAIVLLLLGGSLEALPRKGATAEVKHNVSERLHVITARLLYTTG
jgi:hypothetical protein